MLKLSGDEGVFSFGFVLGFFALLVGRIACVVRML